MAQWLRSAEMVHGGTLFRSVSEEAELGAANILDERAELGRKRFEFVLALVGQNSSLPDAEFLDVFARIGIGLSDNMLKKFTPAEESLAEARKRAEALGNIRLFRVATNFWVMNASDYGRPTEQLTEMLDACVTEDRLPLVDFVIECQRALFLSRLLYRASNREGSHEALAHVMENESFGQLSPLLRGQLLRARGITHTVRHDTSSAREDLTAALRLFEEAGHVPGQVKATQSLARSSLFLNVHEAESQLHAAKTMLATDREGAYPRNTQAAQADLESRIGELHLLQGRPEKALEHFQADQDITVKLGSPTRAMAYVKYNIGRTQLTLGRIHAAIEQLEQSASAFADVGDRFNELRSRVKLIEAFLERRDGAESAREQLDWAQKRFEQLSDKERSRLPANMYVLRARVELHARGDVELAKGLLQRALGLLAPLGKTAEFIRTTIALGEVYQYSGDTESARRYLDQAVRLADAAEMPDLGQLAMKFGADGERSIEEPSDLQRESREEVVERQLTVLVVMLRGYSEFSRQFGLPTLAQVLTDFSRRMAGCVELHDGQLLRFDGDTLLAAFSRMDLPLAPEVLAVQSGLQMCHRFRSLQESWQTRSPKPLHERMPDLRLRVGVATGATISGYFGIKSRRAFAVLGPNVSQAYRMGRCGPDAQVTVCQRTARALAERWPGLALRPIEIAEASERVIRAFAIAADRIYPSPKLSSGISMPPPE